MEQDKETKESMNKNTEYQKSDSEFHVSQEIFEVEPQSGGKTPFQLPLFKLLALIIVVSAVVVIGLTLAFIKGDPGNDLSNVRISTVTAIPGKPVYVEILGRECPWDEEVDCWYDEETGCYFHQDWDNNEWMYWFRGISDRYGDYGWMTYDFLSDRWSIQTGALTWVFLPDQYDTQNLWHF